MQIDERWERAQKWNQICYGSRMNMNGAWDDMNYDEGGLL